MRLRHRRSICTVHHTRAHCGTHIAMQCRKRHAYTSTSIGRPEHDSACTSATHQAAQQVREGTGRPHVQVSSVQGWDDGWDGLRRSPTLP